MINLTEKHKQQIKNKGISIEKINAQIETFKEGIPFVNLVSSATIGNGLLRINENDKQNLIHLFEEYKHDLNLLKFVPASGAASRMFKTLYTFLDKYDPDKTTFQEYAARDNDIKIFFSSMEKLPFYQNLEKVIIQKYPDFKNIDSDHQKLIYVKEMLLEKGLDYGNYPKGLLPFHRYEVNSVTAFEEHLYEAAFYDVTHGKAKLHFTISEDHLKKFKDEYDSIKDRVEKETKTVFDVSFSFQKPSTDTLAVDLNNKPFITDDDTILFRPGGHGALIENLNDQNADIIFIKNIDNVVVRRNVVEVANYKKLLAGILLNVQEKLFEYRSMMEVRDINVDDIAEIVEFLKKEMNVVIDSDFEKFSFVKQIDLLKNRMDRPIRICGMVKNEGEPGGGPFFIEDSKGHISLQIIESAQIDNASDEQMKILKTSTHFNPVDIVCSIKNYKGEKFDLLKFVDHKQAFITEKTKDGKELKALELPGLWNGSMANWNTIFVEVPLVTFNPVKTINDLLKPSHQVKIASGSV